MYRFVTDAIGRFIGSYVVHTAIYAIDNTSHTPSEFNHMSALWFAASLILMDYVIAKRLGNTEWFGLIALVVASLLGFLVFAVSQQVSFAIRGGLTLAANDILIGWLAMSPIFLVPVLIAPLIVRLIAAPIFWVLRPDDDEQPTAA
ncbi:MAG TPA: hypothetical protein VJV05_10075 [Pyrinomonadaceae bacterium]|nr:hypothetical protein [Pyrinomonadaceae bacterium]